MPSWPAPCILVCSSSPRARCVGSEDDAQLRTAAHGAIWLLHSSAWRWFWHRGARLVTGAACPWSQGLSGKLVSACLGCSCPGRLSMSWSSSWATGCPGHPMLAVGSCSSSTYIPQHSRAQWSLPVLNPHGDGCTGSPWGSVGPWQCQIPAAVGALDPATMSAPDPAGITRILPNTGCPPETCSLINYSA